MKKIRELVEQLGLYCKLDVALTDKLEEQETTIYGLKEKQKLMEKELESLRITYSELLLAFRDFKREMGGR